MEESPKSQLTSPHPTSSPDTQSHSSLSTHLRLVEAPSPASHLPASSSTSMASDMEGVTPPPWNSSPSTDEAAGPRDPNQPATPSVTHKRPPPSSASSRDTQLQKMSRPEATQPAPHQGALVLLINSILQDPRDADTAEQPSGLHASSFRSMPTVNPASLHAAGLGAAFQSMQAIPMPTVNVNPDSMPAAVHGPVPVMPSNPFPTDHMQSSAMPAEHTPASQSIPSIVKRRGSVHAVASPHAVPFTSVHASNPSTVQAIVHPAPSHAVTPVTMHATTGHTAQVPSHPHAAFRATASQRALQGTHHAFHTIHGPLAHISSQFATSTTAPFHAWHAMPPQTQTPPPPEYSEEAEYRAD